MEFTKELLERFLKTEPATYGHFPGVNFMMPAMKPLNKKVRLAAPAFTVKLMGKDNGMLYKAMKEGPAGSVLVIDRCGDQVYAAVGEMVVRNAIQLGFAGIVIDGPVTDSLAIEELDFPVFCTGVSVVTTNLWCMTGTYQQSIQCAGVAVHPGDLILGNADGIVVIDKESPDLPGYLETAEEKEKQEEDMRRRFLQGENLLLDVDPLLEATIPRLIGHYCNLGRK